MIQVIHRCFELLELFRKYGILSLKAAEKETGLNKATLCNILKTLSDLGYVSRRGRGDYVITERFRLFADIPEPDRLYSVIRKRLFEFVSDMREGAVGVVRRGNDFYRVSKVFCSDDCVEREDDVISVKPFSMAASWRLLASLPEKSISDISRGLAFPLKTPHGEFASPAELRKALKDTGDKLMYVFCHEVNGFDKIAIALPIVSPEGGREAALSFSLPRKRFTGDYRVVVTKRIYEIKKRIEEDLK
jgi:DNA-binding IclR family transcriptional regulator